MDLPWAKPGEQPDYAGVDAQVEHIVGIDPNALIIPRIHLDAPDWWKKDHPGHIMVYDYGPRTQASPASKPWQQDAATNLRLLVRHLEARYGDHILGYHISAQSAGEWFYDWTWEPIMPCFEEPFRAAFADWVKAKYKTVEALRAAWGYPDKIVGATFESIRVPTLDARRTHGREVGGIPGPEDTAV
jgi:beta-galactosidase GanA